MSVRIQPKNPKMERRDTSLFDGIEVRFGSPELRVDGAFPKIRGYAAVFNQLSQPLFWGMRERIRPGAFKESIDKKDDVRALFNHNPSQVLGRTPSTLKLNEDKIGLHYIIDPPDTSLGNDVMKLIERGDVTQSSFGFKSLDEEYKKEDGQFIRELIRVQLFDVSPVTYPAYTGTSVSVRSLVECDDEYEKTLETFHRDLKLTLDPPYYRSPENERKMRLHKLELYGSIVEANEEAEFRAQKIQSIKFDKASWTLARAKTWCSDHGFKNDKVDDTGNWYRFRQFDPAECSGAFETLTKNMPKGVQMTACKA